jgi:uncharacterized membrane protein
MTDLDNSTPALQRVWRNAPRWVMPLLVGSLALNLLVLGLAAGAAWHLRFGQVAGGGNLLGNLVAYTQTLPDQRRRELAGVLPASLASINAREGQRLPELRPLRQQLQIARRDMMRQFSADPFDMAAFRAAEAAAAKAESRLRETADGLAAELAQHLTAAERAKFLKSRDMRRGRGGPRPPGDDDRPARSEPAKAP